MQKMDGIRSRRVCDKYDYFMAAFFGIAAGVMDICFVGAPGKSVFGKMTEQATDSVVMKFAKLCGWSPRTGKEQSIASAIGFLEKRFPVNYDRAYANFKEHGFDMSTRNHHLKSLGHSPDAIGLFFSILDQFLETQTFISDGKIIVLRADGTTLQGKTPAAKIACGICNWFGHVMSDVAGSSGSRGQDGRGSGLPLPFYNMFLLCDSGEFRVGKDRQDLAVVMTRAFQEGYDLRHGAAMAVPVVMMEIFVRTAWALKRHYYHGLPWRQCIPTISANPSLHKMLLVSYGAFCVMDGADAFVRSGNGANAVAFILHINLVAWGRFLSLVFDYLSMSQCRIEYELRHEKNLETFRRMDEANCRLQEEAMKLLQSERTVYGRSLRKLDKTLVSGDTQEFFEMARELSSVEHVRLQFTSFEEFQKFMRGTEPLIL